MASQAERSCTTSSIVHATGAFQGTLAGRILFVGKSQNPSSLAARHKLRSCTRLARTVLGLTPEAA